MSKVILTNLIYAQTFACEHLLQEVYGTKIMQVYQKVLQQ